MAGRPGPHSRVRHDCRIRPQRGFVARDKRPQPGASPHFLFALENAFHIHGQGALRFEIGLQGLHVGEELSFVVAGAAAVEIVVLDNGIKGRCLPLGERFGRLDIIVSIDKNGGPATGTLPRCIDDGVALGGQDTNLLKTDAAQVSRQPRRASAEIAGVPWLVADAWEADELFQFLNKARTMPASISDSAKRCHGAY